MFNWTRGEMTAVAMIVFGLAGVAITLELGGGTFASVVFGLLGVGWVGTQGRRDDN
jgi:hypothetical protein